MDETIWGGEFLTASYRDFDRVAHLKKVPMPGGSMAIKEPWRMAMVYLSNAFGDKTKDLKIDLMKRVDLQKWNVFETMIQKGFNTPWTSSMGRLFDAISSLLSLRDEVHYEGQAAIELEMITDHGERDSFGFVFL
jgi:hydrogenase maturation protein HypF